MLKIFLLAILFFLTNIPFVKADFRDNGDGTVSDTTTGLIWQKTTSGPMTWESAITYCETLIHAGYDDWRLPNSNELRSLIDYSRYNPSMDISFFPDTVSSYYWSSTTYAFYSDRAWLINYYCDDGGDGLSDYKFRNYFVRAVRAGQLGAFGDFTVAIEPLEALNQGAQWRIDGGMWHDSDVTQKRLAAGIHNLEFKSIDGWTHPGSRQITIIENQLNQTTATYLPTDFQNAVISGLITGQSSDGSNLGVLSDAAVEISGYGTTNTDSQGRYTFYGVPPGNYSIIVSKPGYYTDTEQISPAAGTCTEKHFRLTEQQSSSRPDAYSFHSPDGKSFVPAMNRNLHFDTMVDWNGSPGTVRFLVAGQWHNAAITDTGNGQAKAEIVVSAPSVIHYCSELTIEITNGEGQTYTQNMDVHFLPLIGVIPWYQDNISWTSSGTSLYHSTETLWEIPLPFSSDMFEFDFSMGFNKKSKYDLMSATLSSSMAGKGRLEVKIPTPQPGLKVVGRAEPEISGKLDVSFMGCGQPRVTPSWDIGFKGKAGIEAPAVLVLDIFGVGSALATVPKINDIKLQLFFLPGGSFSGEYPDGQTGDCLFGAYSTTGHITGGLEARAKVDFSKDLNAGVYVGGTGTLHISGCPDWDINGYTGRMYAGAFAEVYSFKTSREIGAEIEWDFTGGSKSLATLISATTLGDTSEKTSWQPVSPGLLEWGNANRLPTGSQMDFMAKSFDLTEATTASAEQGILENLTWVAHPSLIINGTRTTVLYALYDPEKPWYQSSDIAAVTKEGADPWSMNRITDDGASEFSPRIQQMDADTLLAAWSRVDGDVSAAQSPEDIVPHLETIAAFYNVGSNSWGVPAQLTSNGLTDRKPLPISFGTQTGVLWIQNQGQEMVGTSASGDSLLYSGWNGAGWEPPISLWAGPKGIIDYSAVSDAQGECHVVLTVDEDGDPDTSEDLDLHHIATSGGVWQTGQRLTDNTTPDELPLIVNPDGVPVLVWRTDSVLMYSSLSSWNPRNIYIDQEITAAEAPSLDGTSFPGGAVIAYSAQTPDGVDMFAAFYDAALDQWSLPRQLTQDNGAESSLSLAFDGTGIVLSYLKTQTIYQDKEIELNGQIEVLENIPQPGRTDLYVLRHVMEYDLAAKQGSLVVNPVNPAPGTTAGIKVIVENQGDITAQNVPVRLYDGDPDSGGVLIDQAVIASIIAGGSQEVEVSWIIPADSNSHSLFAVVDPELGFDDRDRSNNSISARTVLPDLAVETSHALILSETSTAITSRIVNTGVIPTSRSKVHWHLDNPNGKQIGFAELDSILPGSYREHTLIWDHSDYQNESGGVIVYTVVDAENEVIEIDESNNSHFVAVTVLSDADSDGDGVSDLFDQCPDTPAGVPVDINGCSDAQKDTDGDGLPDDFELSIINADPFDTIQTLLDVHPKDDFDGDGYSNLREFISGSDPINQSDIPECIADFSFDGDVDGVDISNTAVDFGITDCTDANECYCDTDNDGDVDEIDLLFMAEDIGRTDCSH